MPLKFTDYDIEDFIDSLETVLKANMNTYIGQMNTDRSTGPELDEINANAYFVQSLNDGHAAYPTFVFIFEDDVSGISNGEASLETYNIVAAIITPYKNEASKFMTKRLFRYRKVLKTIIRDNLRSNALSRPQKVELSSLSPFPVSMSNSEDMAVAAAINLEVSFA